MRLLLPAERQRRKKAAPGDGLSAGIWCQLGEPSPCGGLTLERVSGEVGRHVQRGDGHLSLITATTAPRARTTTSTVGFLEETKRGVRHLRVDTAASFLLRTGAGDWWARVRRRSRWAPMGGREPHGGPPSVTGSLGW